MNRTGDGYAYCRSGDWDYLWEPLVLQDGSPQGGQAGGQKIG